MTTARRHAKHQASARCVRHFLASVACSQSCIWCLGPPAPPGTEERCRRLFLTLQPDHRLNIPPSSPTLFGKLWEKLCKVLKPWRVLPSRPFLANPGTAHPRTQLAKSPWPSLTDGPFLFGNVNSVSTPPTSVKVADMFSTRRRVA